MARAVNICALRHAKRPRRSEEAQSVEREGEVEKKEKRFLGEGQQGQLCTHVRAMEQCDAATCELGLQDVPQASRLSFEGGSLTALQACRLHLQATLLTAPHASLCSRLGSAFDEARPVPNTHHEVAGPVAADELAV